LKTEKPKRNYVKIENRITEGKKSRREKSLLTLSSLVCYNLQFFNYSLTHYNFYRLFLFSTWIWWQWADRNRLWYSVFSWTYLINWKFCKKISALASPLPPLWLFIFRHFIFDFHMHYTSFSLFILVFEFSFNFLVTCN